MGPERLTLAAVLLGALAAAATGVPVVQAETPSVTLASASYRVDRPVWAGEKDDPDDPEDPDDPDDPDDPADPDEPDEPDQPDQPDEPDQPDVSEEPDTPDDPNQEESREDDDSDPQDESKDESKDDDSDDDSDDDQGSDDGDEKADDKSGSDDASEDEAPDDKKSGKDDADDEQGAETGNAQALNDDVSDVDSSAGLLEPVIVEKDAEGFDYRRGEIVAIDLDDADLQASTALGFEVVQSFDAESVGARVFLLRSRADLATPEAIALLKLAAPGAAFAPNHLFYAPSADGKSIAATAPRPGPSCDCRVGMLDTAVDPQHPSLLGVSVRQRAFLTDRINPAEHGAAVASLIFGRESGRSELYVADVFSGGGSRSGAATSVIRGLEWLSSSGVPVVNISLAGPSNPVVEAIIKRMTAKGTIVVAAVGNDGPAAPAAYPAALPQVVAVTAVDGQGHIYRYAVRGDHVDFAAPGVQVVAAGLAGRYVRVTGTSFAAPIVAGRIAASVRRGSAKTALQDLQREASDLGAPGRDRIFGFGLIGSGRP